MQLAAYCIALLAEYLPEKWLAELRDVFQVPSPGMLYADTSTNGRSALIDVSTLALETQSGPLDAKLVRVIKV